MKTENLELNKRYRNFKELAQCIEVDPDATHHSKDAIIKELRRFVRYSHPGQAYIILEIYQMPLSQNDGRTKTIYGKQIENIIMHMLANQGHEFFVRTREFIALLGLINHRYAEYQYNPHNLALNLKMDEKIVVAFYRESYDKFVHLIEAALNRMQRKKSITWGKSYVCMRTDGKTYEADYALQTAIIQADIDTMNQMGIKDKYVLILKNRYGEFMKAACELLRERGICDIQYYYKAYKITLINFALANGIMGSSIQETKKNLNNIVVRQFGITAEKNGKSEEYKKLIEYTLKE